VALILKLVNFSFIFIVPAFVESTCIAGATFCMGKSSLIASSLIALAGPFVNFLLWLISYIIIKNNLLPKKYKRWEPALILTARINFFLMLFNMIPIPGFDGYHFFTGLIDYFGLLHFFF
jgi:Zn-dependent protease